MTTPLHSPRRRARRAPLLAAAVLALLLLSQPSSAFFPITSGNVQVKWSNGALPVSYLLQSEGSDDIADDGEFTAIRLAFQTWEDIPTSAAAFAEDVASDPTRTDFAAPDIHLIWFDENNSSGLFPGASAAIALTPVTYNLSDGTIIDADIIFNGDDYTFSTDAAPGTHDVQGIATHEIGHFLGLDHCASHASTMFPYAEDGRTVQRSLTADDEGGASDLYPDGGVFGNISGFVVNLTTSTLIRCAHVVAVNDEGVVVTTTYSSSLGSFFLERLPAGQYLVYAEPLDGPVTGANLSSSIGATATTSFQTAFLGGNAVPTIVTVSAGATTSVGVIDVGAAVPVNLEASGTSPYTAVRGNNVTILIAGTGVASTDTVSVRGNDVTVNSSTFVDFVITTGFLVSLSIDADAALGPRSVELTTNAGDLEMMTGLIEVCDPAPSVTNISPALGSVAGGEVVVISGGDFQDTPTVIFGDQLAASVVVDSAAQLSVVTPPDAVGTVNVYVQNPDGQLAIASAGFQYVAAPVVASVAPAAGSSAGGTSVTISGDAFLAGAIVTFGGNPAAVDDTTTTSITCTTPAGLVGPVDVVVLNPGGWSDTVTNGFTYLATPDPAITAVTPSTGSTTGGTTITLIGANFDPAATVVLDAAPDGSGGTPLTSVQWVNDTTITAVTPPHSSGTYSITVAHPSGAAVRESNAFTYQTPPAGGGGGGGCMCVPPVGRGPSGPEIFGGLMPYLALALLLLKGAFAKPPRRRGQATPA